MCRGGGLLFLLPERKHERIIKVRNKKKIGFYIDLILRDLFLCMPISFARPKEM